MKRLLVIFLIATVPIAPLAQEASRPLVRVGSKNFNEGYVLAEVFAKALEASGFKVERKFGLGGTLVCYQALVTGEIDVYPEYTGTITRAILELDTAVDDATLRRMLRDAKHARDWMTAIWCASFLKVAFPAAGNCNRSSGG